ATWLPARTSSLPVPTRSTRTRSTREGGSGGWLRLADRRLMNSQGIEEFVGQTGHRWSRAGRRPGEGARSATTSATRSTSQSLLALPRAYTPMEAPEEIGKCAGARAVRGCAVGKPRYLGNSRSTEGSMTHHAPNQPA